MNSNLHSWKSQVLIEHTSANPKRSIPRWESSQRYTWRHTSSIEQVIWKRDVRAEYYVDDMGKQVGVFGMGSSKSKQRRGR